MDISKKKKPVLFKGFSQSHSKPIQQQQNIRSRLPAISPLLKGQPIKNLVDINQNAYISNRFFSASIDNILTNNSTSNITTYLINGRILKGPLRNLLDNGDKFKDSYFQACLVPETYTSRQKTAHSYTTKNQNKHDLVLDSRKKHQIQINANYECKSPVLNHNLSEYLRIRSAYK